MTNPAETTQANMQRAINNVLKILRFEFTRFNKLVNNQKKLQEKAEKSNDNAQIEQNGKDIRYLNNIIGKQNQIFHMCLELLYRGEGYEETFLKNISKYIIWLVDRNDDGLLRAAFSMLEKIIYQVYISFLSLF